jgi:hypothetical protein
MTKAKKLITATPDSPETPVSLETITAAIQEGRSLIDQGKPKAEAAMAIFRLIEGCSQVTVVQAFIEGASLTPKGALTYWYNCKRKLAKERRKSD